MEETKLTVTIEGEAAARLIELAELSGRSAEWFANFMIAEYADRELGIVRDLKAAIRSADEGNVVPHEEVMVMGRSIIERARRKKAS